MKKLSFRDIHHFSLYARPLNLAGMVWERTGNRILAEIARPIDIFFPNRAADTSGIKKLTKLNCPMMDDFWNRIRDKFPIMGVRDAKYIVYRYLDVPRRVYFSYIAIENDRIVAFAVGRIRETVGFQAGMIADFFFVHGHEKQAVKLIKVLINRMRLNGASLAGCIMLSHTEEAAVMKKCGFYHILEKLLPQTTPLILRALDSSINQEALSEIRNWFFTTGDYDVV